jgi:hypothetical protein
VDAVREDSDEVGTSVLMKMRVGMGLFKNAVHPGCSSDTLRTEHKSFGELVYAAHCF